MTTPAENKAIVLEAFDTLFNKRDYEKAATFWSDKYIQHSAHIPPGRDGLFNLVRASPPTVRYKNDLIMAEGDRLMLHGQFSGRGDAPNWIACDIVRMENRTLAEHWDVLQDEATKEQSVSGLPMFGTSFPPASPNAPLTVEEARKITAPLYEALNEPAKKDINALLAAAAHPDYQSYHTNEEFLTRDQLAEIFKGMGVVTPNLHWLVKDIMVIGDTIIVRGEATGTPIADFWGAKSTGKSFKTMAIDVFSVRDGKLARAYHVENWMTALQQIAK